MSDLRTSRRWLLRCLVGAGILGAIADLRLPPASPSPPPIALVDVSASVGTGPLAPPEGARIDSRWMAFADGVRVLDGQSEAPALSREATCLTRALREAAARFPGRDLWVFTDGRATEDGVAEAARAVVAGGGRVHVSPPAVPCADVAILEARARRQARGGSEVLVQVASSSEGEVRLVLTREGRVVGDRRLRLPAGGAREPLVFVDPAAPRLGAAYELRLEPLPGTPDDDPSNDRLSVGLPGDRTELIVWGDLAVPAWSRPGASLRVRNTPALEPGLLQAADAVVLTGLPWARIGEERVRDLLRFVAGGGQLLLLGGPRSWAAGGWAGTGLERDLAPLRTPIPPTPGLALAVALDRSGSTSQGALAHLVEAARGLVRDLRPGEQVAVLPFSAPPDPSPLPPGWVVGDARPGEPAGIGGRASVLEESLGRLVPGGGTDLPAAIVAAARLAAGSSARDRRVLLLTDGDPDHAPDEEALAAARRELDALGVRFGAVVSGMPEAARRLAAGVARDPSDVVLLPDAGAIPDQVRGEISRLRAEGERRGAPDALEGAPGVAQDLLDLAPSSLQSLELVPGAELLAWATWAGGDGRSAPFAARRAVGAGAVLALAWGPEAEPDPPGAGARLTALVERLGAQADRGVGEAEVRDGRLVLRAPQATGAGRLVWRSAGREGGLVESAPGVFGGPAPPESPEGVLVGPVGAEGAFRPVRLPGRPPPEHRGAGVDEDRLRALASAGQGLRLPPLGPPPAGRPPPGTPLAPWLLAAALGLLVLERWPSSCGEAGPGAGTRAEDPT